MAIYFHLTSSACTPERVRQIANLLKRKSAIVRPNLDRLPQGRVIEVAYEDKRSRYDQALSTGIDASLKSLGVAMVHRDGDLDQIIFTHGPSETLDGIRAYMAQPGLDATALLHVINTHYFPGVPNDNLRQIEDDLPGVKVRAVATGAASARGVAATGNLGAVNHLQIFARIYGADVTVLNGGQGTRLFGLRKLKGDVLFGNCNLTKWNIMTALYFKSEMPAGRDYVVTLANDGILVPFGRLTWQGQVLKEVAPADAKDGYFFVSPDDPDQMTEGDTKRFGMVALRSDGSFICATEKVGRQGTKKEALDVLAARGIQANEKDVRLYINYFGMSTTQGLEEALEKALQTVVRPGLTMDDIGDLDTYSLLFSALSCNDPADFRAAIEKMGLNRLIAEGITDKVLFARFREALFVQDADGRDVPRFGFAEFNRGAVSLDIGTLPSLFGFYLDLIRNFAPSGKERARMLELLGQLDRREAFTDAQKAEVEELETKLRTGERVVRHTTQRIAGFDPSQVIEGCEFEADPSGRVPIIGVSTDEYTLPQGLTRDGIEMTRSLQSIVSAKATNLQDYFDAEGRLLFRYDPEGINTVKLSGCRIMPGAIIGRNVVAINSQIGNGSDEIIIAENGAIVASRVEQSVTLKQPEIPTDLALLDTLRGIARDRKGETTLHLPGGWDAQIRLVGNQQSQDVIGQLHRLAGDSGQKDGRVLPKIKSVLGISEEQGVITLDTNDGINRVEVQASANFKLSASDPNRVFVFSVSFSKRQQPQYIFYGREQTSPVVVTGDCAYASKQPVANAPAMQYEVPFNADPSKDRLALYGGIVMKDPRVQEEFGYYTRFRLREDADLSPLAGDIAAEVESFFHQLPAVIGLPRDSVTSVTIDRNEMQAVIENAIARQANISDAIIDEIGEQTPAILGQYIARVTGSNPDVVAREIQKSTGRNKTSVNGLCAALNIQDPAQISATRKIVESYPLSQLYFVDYNSSKRAFVPVVDALIEQFRMEEIQMFEPIDPADPNSTVVSMPMDDGMQLPPVLRWKIGSDKIF